MKKLCLLVTIKWSQDSEGQEDDDGDHSQDFILEKIDDEKDYPGHSLFKLYYLYGHGENYRVIGIPKKQIPKILKTKGVVEVYFDELDVTFGPHPLVYKNHRGDFYGFYFNGYTTTIVRQLFLKN